MTRACPCPTPPEDEWSCAGNHSGDLNGTADASKAEAIMMLSCMMRDKEGRRIGYRMPAALAVAIVNAFGCGDPETYALSRRRW